MEGNGCVIGAWNNSGTIRAPGVWTLDAAMPRIARINTGGPIDTWPQAPDPNFSSVSLLLHFDEQGDLLNWGNSGAAVYYDGATPIVSQKKFGAASAMLDQGLLGSSSQIRGITSSAYALGTGDFSFEFWIFPTSFVAAGNIFDFRTVSNSVAPLLYVTTLGSIRYFVSNADRITSANNALTLLNWQFIQLIRSSGTTKLYINTVQVGSNYTDSNNYVQGGFAIGNSNTQVGVGAAGISACMAEFRLSKGVARSVTLQTSRWPDY